nr:50S ribosomal protein L4 [Bacteroidales bacterium]
DNAIMVIEDFTFETPKTKDFIVLEQNIKTTDIKSVLVMPDTDKNVVLSARNLAKTEVVTADKLNIFQVLNCRSLVLTVSALQGIEKNFKAEEA